MPHLPPQHRPVPAEAIGKGVVASTNLGLVPPQAAPAAKPRKRGIFMKEKPVSLTSDVDPYKMGKVLFGDEHG